MRRFVHALIVAVPALVAGASAVRASDTTCTSSLTGTINGNVVVPDGASCTLSDATVAGNVHVLQNASLTVDATQQPTTIDGNVHADHCAFALLQGGVTVTGNVRIGQCAQQSGFVGPGVKIGGNFACTHNRGPAKPTLAMYTATFRSTATRVHLPTSASLRSAGTFGAKGTRRCRRMPSAPTLSAETCWVSAPQASASPRPRRRHPASPRP